MSEEEDFHQLLERKFPQMRPMTSTPTLFSLNGFGLGMAGKRAFDAETGSYIKTHCLTALFIPLFTFGAYRVADAPEGGWYFLGKEEKSGFSKIWNLLVIAAIAGMIGTGMWSSHKKSPGYLADRAMEKAQVEVDEEKHLQAAKTYRKMLSDDLPRAEEATSGLRDSVMVALGSTQPEDALAAVEFSCALPSSLIADGQALSEVPAKVDFTVKRVAEAHPAVALEMLDSVERLPVVPADLSDRRLALLHRLVKEQPDEPEHAVTLAGILEEKGEIDEAYAVLEPHIDGLGSGDGARILGQILLAQGEAAKAVPLLESYIEPRLKSWRAAEKNYESAAEAAYQRVLDKLNRGDGPPSFFRRYEAAKGEEEQGRIVDEYVFEKMSSDSSYQRAVKNYERTSEIIPVLMDLGISELQAAQTASDPGLRKELLDKAEEHFLSLQSSAGDSAEFKFFLGQVYYWSGRQDEGRAQFDELLESSGRDVNTLVTLATTLREIGNVPEAKKLAEEAFEKGKSDEDRDGAASLLSVLVDDIDEEIKWLEKVSSSDLQHTTRLARAYAQKARGEGDDKEAVRQLRIAEKGWEKLPVTSASMNNGALVQFEIFGLTGDVSAYENGSRMMERGVALAPDNSILLGNASSSLASTAMMQAVEGKLHPRIIQDGIGFDQLHFLYRDSQSRAPIVEAIKQNDNFQRSLDLLDRALILAPNGSGLYSAALGYRSFIQDEDGLERLFSQLDAARFDTSEGMEEYGNYLRGDNDEELLEGKNTSVASTMELLEAIEDVDQRRHVEVSLAELRMSMFAIGDEVDVDKEIAILTEALAAYDCVAYVGAMETALAQKAAIGLAESNGDFKKLLESCRRYLSAQDLLVLALTSEALRPIVLADAAAKDFFSWTIEHDERFPGNRTAESVIMIQHLAPDRHAEARQQFVKNRSVEIGGKIANAMAPSVPGTVMVNYLRAMALGNDAEAKALLKAARDKGVLTPSI